MVNNCLKFPGIVVDLEVSSVEVLGVCSVGVSSVGA